MSTEGTVPRRCASCGAEQAAGAEDRYRCPECGRVLRLAAPPVARGPSGYCPRHPDLEVTGVCASCGRFTCTACDVSVTGLRYCVDCRVRQRRSFTAPVAWEERREIGRWQAWYRTTSQVTSQPNAFFERLKGGEFDAALTGWGAALVVDPSRLWKSDGVYNFPGYSSPEVDELIEQGLGTTDPAVAARSWRALQARIHADQPACFLYWRDELVAVHERFADVGIDTLWLFTDLHRWWVPADARRRP